MRTLRLSLVGAVILVLLGGLGSAIVAQDEETGELSGTAVYIDGLRMWQYRDDETTRYELEMSDPRADGTYTEIYPSGDRYDGESVRPTLVGLADVRLVNDEGRWWGLESGVWDDEMGWHITAWLAGEGAYEGLTLYLHADRSPVFSTPEMAFEGIIFDTTPPVMLDLRLPPVTRDVVVAARFIEAGDAIGADMLKIWPVTIDDTNSMAFTDPAQVVGTVAAIDILQSQLLTPNMLEYE